MPAQSQEDGKSQARESSPAISPVAPARVPQPSVPDYELLRLIAVGAYGEVWLARSTATGVLRAAKIVWRHRFEDERPFQREFEGIQKFERISREHPSQLALFHIGRNEAEGYFYYVMELADDLGTQRESRSAQPEPSASATPHSYVAHTLRADLARGRLPAAQVLELGLTLAEALGHLHRNGLIHRDVKPSNVIFVNGRPKLADIGLVTDASDQCSIVGTEGYLPPEGPGSPQADIFALGKVLYEAATGLDRRELPGLPTDLRCWPDTGSVLELNEIVLKACASKSRERYASVEAMIGELKALQAGRSIKRRRTAQWWWAAARRVGLSLAGVGAAAALGTVLIRGRAPLQTYGDGPDSTNNEANGSCRIGMDIIRDNMYEQLGEAYAKLTNAAFLDPRFARPHIGMLTLRLRERSPDVPPMTTDELQETARKLNELAPNTAPAYCAQSVVAFYDCHFPEAEKWALQAIRADPKYELAHTFYAFMLIQWGSYRLAEASNHLAISEGLLPLKATIPRCKGHIAYMRRDFTGAISNYANALAIEPHHAPAVFFSARAYQALGDYTNAIAYFRRFKDLLATTESGRKSVDNRYDRLLQAFLSGGPKAYWDDYRQEAASRGGDYYWKAVIQLHLGDTNGALRLLNASYTNHEHSDGFQTPLTCLLFDEWWDGLHDNPEFIQLLGKLSFPEVMQEPKGSGRSKR